MKKALIYSLSLALLLVVVLVACNKPQADRSTEPQEPDPAAISTQADVSTPELVKDTTPEPTANTTPEPPAEQTPPAPTENEATQPPEDTTPQEPAQEQTAEPPKETEPVTQSSGGSGSTTQTKPQGQQGQQGQTQQSPSGSTQSDEDAALQAMLERKAQMNKDLGMQGADGSKRMDQDDPRYGDWVQGLVGELNGN